MIWIILIIPAIGFVMYRFFEDVYKADFVNSAKMLYVSILLFYLVIQFIK